MFNPKAYGEEVARILALEGNGERLMPLAGQTCSSSEARDLVNQSKLPSLVRAGLYLYFGCWTEAHELVDDLETPDGMYWHAMVHRQEPDASNSAYWFRRVGKHHVFPALRAKAAEIGVDLGERWDPIKFIDYCERAREQPGSDVERKARELQRAEWQLLFDHCARH